MTMKKPKVHAVRRPMVKVGGMQLWSWRCSHNHNRQENRPPVLLSQRSKFYQPPEWAWNQIFPSASTWEHSLADTLTAASNTLSRGPGEQCQDFWPMGTRSRRMCFFLRCGHHLVLSHVWLFITLWTVARQASLCMGFSRQEYWSGLPFLLQGIFLAQGLNLQLLCLLHCRQILYLLSHWVWSYITLIQGIHHTSS